MATKLYTIPEVAEMLRVSCGTVYRLIAAQRLSHVRIGLGRGKILVPFEAIAAYLETQTVEAPKIDSILLPKGFTPFRNPKP